MTETASKSISTFPAVALRVLIAGGGTGGHLFPGIAIAQELEKRYPSVEVLFLGTGRRLESRIMQEVGYAHSQLPVSGLKGIKGIKLFKRLLRIPWSLWVASRIVRGFRPSIVIGLGGYSSGPPLLIASLWGIPTILQEPNAYPGMTNRLLGRFSQKVVTAFPESDKFFSGKAVLTGNPIRSEFQGLLMKPPTMPFVLLIFGGSQGAHAINQAVLDSLEFLRPLFRQLNFIHQTGDQDYDWVLNTYREVGAQGLVQRFFTDMPRQFEKAHLVLCRAGATTLGELTMAGKASLLIPFPEATDNHQQRNADALARWGAAEVIPQSILNGRYLANRIEHYFENLEQLGKMEEKSLKARRLDSAQKIVDLIEELVIPC